MSFCADCIKGVRHEGTPEGKIEQIAGIECYVATPEGEYAKDKAILYLTDVFGHKLINHQLLADDFARNGFRVIVPDLFQEPCPPNCFDPGVTFDLGAWFGRNGIDFSEPRVRTVLAALREQGVTRIAVTGYCYGARSGFNLAFEKAIDVLAVSHPSLLKVPEDIQKYKDTAVAPLLINSCTVDHMFPLEVQPKADEILGDGKFAPGYKRPYWEGCTHGFAVRGDLSDPKVKAGKEGAFKEVVEWFKAHL